MAEIRETIGMSGSPTIAAMSHCNYHLAFFDEVLRCSNVADFTFFHKPTKPVVNFAGHVITDDKLLMGNIWACHNNPDVWEEPHQFKPERLVCWDSCLGYVTITPLFGMNLNK